MGTLFIISGPSGVGKSTIRNEILKMNDNLWFSISMTTREKRNSEVDGVDYYFVSKEYFKENIEKNNFLEYVEVYNDVFYGTPKDKVLDKLNNGINVLLEIDVVGALRVKENFDEAVLIFISPKDVDTLRERLIGRNTDRPEVIDERLNKAYFELSMKHKYDYIVVNDDLDKAIMEVNEIIGGISK